MTARVPSAARPRPASRPPLDRGRLDPMKRASLEAAEQALELSEAITRRPGRRRTRG